MNTRLDRIASVKHVGSTSVRTFIEKRQLDVTICGHIHEARGTDVIGRTKIVNCGPVASGFYALIDVGKEITVTMKP